ncbi:nuclear transport factor 2 family protein [Micromonospora endophytica]|uniref:Polyketide cyclase n=1 Tax=Micromonospora endophytica TaxID=515350 RepID=A0A2W2C8B9_9ACTN|nr:nuclear transport factor 2 family protein [Micromonospora endophytica]PZF94902.1 polyketide cyclase [Micromonospora endophytica]RIW47357.1 nuclear transport factor 2 family protein [Micromonospora endophytica]BCJ60835.1 isomerase [Micromonospora endophytica]
MSTHTDLVDRYLAVWNEPDAERRATAVAALFTTDASYTDPLAAIRGHEEIVATVTGVRDAFPEHEFRRHGDVDGHHDVVRFGWALVPAEGGEAVVIGFDVAVHDSDGRIRAVHGFLDKVPATT